MHNSNTPNTLLRDNESGFVLVVAMLILVLLSIIGVSALTLTEVDSQIAANVRQEKQVFYGTESGCKRGGQWLFNLSLAQADLYADVDTKNDYITAGDFTKGMKVRSVTAAEETNIGDANYPVKYLYDVSEQENAAGSKISCKPIPGNNPNILKCFYQVDCSSIAANGGSRDIGIVVGKPTQF